MKTIRALVPPTLEPVFQTAQEALKYRSPRNVQLEKDTAGLKHKVIEGGSWTDYKLELYLSNARTLRFELDGVKVKWTVEPHVQPAKPVQPPIAKPVRLPLVKPVRPPIAEPVALELRTGVNSRPRRVLWDREGALRRCVGRRIKKVFAGAACLWLYMEGTSTLLYFNRLLQGAGQKDLLYWTEEQ